MPDYQESYGQLAASSKGERLHMVDGLGSFIDFYGTQRLRDAQGNLLSRTMEQTFLRLKRINDIQVHTIGRESDYRALRVLNSMSNLLQVPPTSTRPGRVSLASYEAVLRHSPKFKQD